MNARSRLLRSICYLFLLAGAVLSIYAIVSKRTTAITIYQSDAQEQINDRLPLSGQRGPLNYIINEMEVTFQEDGRLGFTGTFDVSGFGRAGIGNISGSGTVAYADGQFFFRNTQITNLTMIRTDIAGLGSQLPASQLGRIANSMISRIIPPEDIEIVQQRARDRLRQETFEMISSTIANSLDRVPIYTLQSTSMTGMLARASLDRIEVRNQEMIAHIDPFKFIYRVFIWIVTGFFAILLTLSLIVAYVRSNDS